MNMDVCFPRPFSTAQFASLFSPTIVDHTLDSLSEMAGEGHQYSIEILLQLALRDDHQGNMAEQKLFDLYSNKAPAFPGVAEQISQGALALYTLYGEKQRPDQQPILKMSQPSRLLYMAGEAGNITQKQDITARLSQEGPTAFDNADLDDGNLWHHARRLDSDEIHRSLMCHPSLTDLSPINYPIGLIDPISQQNLLIEQISQQIKSPDFLENPEFFPINTGDHWVVFGLYKLPQPEASPCAFIFDSANALDSATKRQLIAAAKYAGVEQDNQITFIQQNIQQYTPNSCGVFTVEAIRILLEESGQQPETNLQSYLNSFAQRSREEQMAFNREKRSQIYEQAFLSQHAY